MNTAIENKEKPSIIAIFICPKAGDLMQYRDQAEAIAGCGLEGDRYCTGAGSFSQGRVGNRQVTLINSRFFAHKGFQFSESRRNIVTIDVELSRLINKEFTIGDALMRGVKYCYPCNRPSELIGKKESFREAFFDCAGIVAEIIVGGTIKRLDPVAMR